MAWHLHITEGEDGRWSCSHGRHHFDSHEDITEALDHLRTHAATLGGVARVIIHKLDGTIERLGTEGDVELQPDA